MGLHFDELAVGDGWDTAAVTLSEADIVAFAREWDPQPFHLDHEAAAASVFGGLCASGLHTLLHTYRLWLGLQLFEGTILAGLGTEGTRMSAPVMAGDTIRVRASVAHLQPTSKPDRGLLKMRLATSNGAGVEVMEMLLVMLVRRSADHCQALPDR